MCALIALGFASHSVCGNSPFAPFHWGHVLEFPFDHSLSTLDCLTPPLELDGYHAQHRGSSFMLFSGQCLGQDVGRHSLGADVL